MPTPHPAIAAVPVLGEPNRGLMQALLVAGLLTILDDAADPRDFDPRGEGGTVAPLLWFVDALFKRDPADSTSLHDGVTVLVTVDNSRYKRIGDDLIFTFSVLSRTVTTPPDPNDPDPGLRPALGDAYLVPAAASGEWATKEKFIAVWTSRGWAYIGPRTGRLVYVEAEDAYVRYRFDGTWVTGFGNAALPDASLIPSMLLGGAERVRFSIENQTTDIPPAVVNGVSYIVGPAPTGVWTGQSGKIAHGENGAWRLYAPIPGMRAYDKSVARDYQWDGAAWISAAGNWRVNVQAFTADGTWTRPPRCFYVFVEVVGGGGGSRGANGNGGNGGTSSFGAHCSATGGGGGTSSTGGLGGTATGGDGNFVGDAGMFDPSGTFVLTGGAAGMRFGSFGRGGATTGTTLPTGAGGGAGVARKWIPLASLGANELVTVGAAGTPGPQGGIAGEAGLVVVTSYILD